MGKTDAGISVCGFELKGCVSEGRCYSGFMNEANKTPKDITREILISTQALNTEDFLLALRGGEQREALDFALANEQIAEALEKL